MANAIVKAQNPKLAPRVKVEETPEAKALGVALRDAVKAVFAAGYTVECGGWTIRQGEVKLNASAELTNAANKVIDRENKATQAAATAKVDAIRTGVQGVIRRIWNNDVTFDNIDSELESTLG